MKSTITEKSHSQDIEYPCLMISKESGCLVLFTSENNGTVMHTGNAPVKLGEYDNKWAMSFFKPFNGTVSLSND